LTLEKNIEKGRWLGLIGGGQSRRRSGVRVSQGYSEITKLGGKHKKKPKEERYTLRKEKNDCTGVNPY